MAASYPGPVQVGSYFVGQYYQVLQQQPDLVHQFYSDASTMIRVDGDSSESASATLQIHTMVMSLNFTAIEIKTINSLDSWNGGVLVMVSVSDYILEEEARDYVNSVSIEDDPVDKYSLPEQPQQEDVEAEVVVEEAPAEETHVSHDSVVNSVPELPAVPMEEPVGEPPKKTYASILRVAREQSTSSVQVQVQPSYNKIPQSTSEWEHTPEPAIQQSHSAWSDVPESAAEIVEEGLISEEGEYAGEYKSVYVRNLPSTVTASEIEQEFKNFGRIKPDGIFIRNRKDVVGVCYAFVEFEDIAAVQNAIKASPIQLAGRQVFIEERRPNSSSTRGGTYTVNIDAAIQIDQEGEEAGVATYLKPQEVALVLVVWVGETTKNPVITDLEAMASISAVLDKTASWELIDIWVNTLAACALGFS
ncbi:hypothetical protein COLO4_10570 [Corchorus olitorius]|uniref:RRM domain-containing protein n=1 Tax=Corchorus olitorius TaxID=93759 RepID=A0A1R3K880_9ROSI|nr:hypothetical protein COLO4_10570 [Corchorus olitorius]